MAEKTTYQKIPRVVETKDDLDFAYLKELGLEYIQSVGGSLWTDFNEHDPGVTSLEMLCYAISDLSARIEMPIADLLSPASGSMEQDQFHRASAILPTCPVTELDYRKIFLEIDGIRNCWMMPFEQKMYADCKNNLLSYTESDLLTAPNNQIKMFTLKGLNSLAIDYDLDADIFTNIDRDNLTPAEIEDELDNAKAVIRKAVWEKYHENRNLCEDLVEIKEVAEHKISICAKIELDKTADKNRVHAQIELAIEDYFSPRIHYYSLQEMLDKGYGTEEIFEGPLLTKGFIDDEELRETALRSQVRLSDIVRLIMDIEGVQLIETISIRDCKKHKEGLDWLICIDPFTKPTLAPTIYKDGEGGDCAMTSVYNYSKDVLPVNFNRDAVDNIKSEIRDAQLLQQLEAALNKTLKLPKGTYRSPSETTTIQNDFPTTYGIGLNGLPGGSSIERKAQALQLKAYIAVFDQILATYFAHLGKVRDLFAMNSGTNPTYFTQAIKDIKNFDAIVMEYPTNDDELLSEKLIGFLDDNIDRRNEILDHLIARFAEKFSNYTFLMTELYGDASEELIVQAKEQFLQEYVELSGARFKAYNIQGPETWDTNNISGTQKRIARLGGLRDYSRRDLSITHISIQKVSIGIDMFEYQWSIKNGDAIPIPTLQHFTAASSASTASKYLYRTVYLLINTRLKNIENAFLSGVSDGTLIDHVRINESGGFYSFSVVDPELGGSEIASPYGGLNFASASLLETALVEFITFLKDEATEEGIFLVEHILLRPNLDTPVDGTNGIEDLDFSNIPIKSYLPICVDDCDTCCQIDPYSFRVSLILPGYTKRFSDVDFRIFMENLIANEIPAHVLPRICWIGYRDGEHVSMKDEFDINGNVIGQIPDNELIDFENTFKVLLESLRLSRDSDTVIVAGVDEETIALDATGQTNLIEFIKVFSRLHTIHHVGRLHNCESEDIENSIILGRTNLGTL